MKLNVRRCGWSLALLAVVGAGAALLFLREDGAAVAENKGSAGEPGLIAAASTQANRVQPKTPASRPATVEEFFASLPTNQTASVRGTKAFVVRCETGFSKPLRLAVEATGARTIGVRSSKELLVEANEATRSKLTADDRFSTTDEFLPVKKVSEDLAQVIAKGETEVQVTLLALSDADRTAVSKRVVANGGEILTGCLNGKDSFCARMPAELVSELTGYGDVRWMEKFEYPHLMNDLAVNPVMMNVRGVWDVHGLSGAKQKISTSDSGIDSGDTATMHPDLKGRVKDIKVVDGCSPTDVNGHGTHTAGSIVGEGVKSATRAAGQIRGSAWGADLYAWFCGAGGGGIRTPSSLLALFRGNNTGDEWDTYIHSASWGSSYHGQYTAQCALFDAYVWVYPEFLPVISAGNDGDLGKGTICTPASSKNVLAVGATQSSRPDHDGGWGNGNPKQTVIFSSRGPCLDGRIKPEIATPGVGIISTRSHGVNYGYGIEDEWYAYDSGTSMACPLMAGAVALVREWLVNERGIGVPSSALMKAIVTGGAKDAATPNNDQGWGRADIAQSLFPSDRAVRLVDYIPFADGAEFQYVVETTNSAPLDVQLAWIDYPGDPTASQAAPKLINNLDLSVEQIEGGDGSILLGNGGSEPDSVNNLESVRIASAEPDMYLITVTCRNIPFDYNDGGAAALYIRGAFDPNYEPTIPDRVRIRRTGTVYASLDKALPEAVEDDVVEILSTTRLRKPYTLTENITIVATNDDPTASMITCLPGATLTVAAGHTLALSNVCLSAASGGTSVRTLPTAQLAVSGKVKLGTVVLDDSQGLKLAGPLDIAPNDIVVRCDDAQNIGEQFGVSELDYDTTTNSVANIVNYWDDELSGFALFDTEKRLIWRVQPIAEDEALVKAVGWYLGEENVTTYFKSYTKLFKAYTNGATITVLKNVDELPAAPEILRFAPNMKIKVMKPMSIASATGKKTIRPGAGCCFEVVEGGSLSLSSLIFDGATVDSVVDGVTNKVGYSSLGNDQFLRVDGGTVNIAASVEIKNFTTGSLYKDIKGANMYGPILLRNGELNITGANIHDCHAVGDGSHLCYGGGIAARSGRLNISGNMQIKNCTASKYGNGVYLWNGVEGAQLTLAGSPNIDGLYVAAKNLLPIVDADYAGTAGKQVIFDFFPGQVGVDVVGGLTNCVFATYSGSNADAVKKGLINRTYKDDSRVYAVAEDGKLFWYVAPKSVVGQAVDRDSGRCAVYPKDGSEPTYWKTLGNALDALTGDASIELYKTTINSFSADVDIRYNVALYSTNSSRVRFRRTADASFNVPAGASLSVSNLSFASAELSGDVKSYSKPYFNVNGGQLTFDDSQIDHFLCRSRNAGGIRVYGGGSLVMGVGSEISLITNSYVVIDKPWESGSGVGVLVEGRGSSAKLGKVRIFDCLGTSGSGLFVGNEAEVEIGEGFECHENYDYATREADADDRASNVARHDTALLKLSGVPARMGLTVGPTRITETERTYNQDTNCLAVLVGEDSYWTDANLRAAADNVRRDSDGCVAKAVTNANARLLVWRTAIDTNDLYTAANGEQFALVGFGEPKPTELALPTARQGLIYNAEPQDGLKYDPALVSGGYIQIVDNVATDASDAHYATVTILDPSAYCWSDGSTDPKRIRWRIAKKDLRVTPADAEPWNLHEHGNEIDPATGETAKPGYGSYYLYFDATTNVVDDVVETNYTYTVEGLCAGHEADDVLIAHFVYMPGGLLMTNINYRVSNSSIEMLNDNYRVKNADIAKFSVISNATLLSAMPRSVSNRTDVEVALADFKDTSVRAKIADSADPVAAYQKFRLWALNTVGEAAAADSPNAMLSYELGAESLFANKPTLDLTEPSVNGGEMTLKVKVSDGDDAKAVAIKAVRDMFKATSDLGDWSKGDIEFDVKLLTGGDKASEMSFRVVPATKPDSMFIRLQK